MSIFPTKILLATDGSEEAQLALSTAVDQANSTNSELHLVTVGPWNPDPAYATHEASFRWQTYEEVIEGIGKEAWPDTLDRSVVDRWITVSDRDSFLTARRITREEGILAGGSSGTAVWAALEVARDLGPDDFVVVILPDSGKSYLSKIYNEGWMLDHGFVERPGTEARIAEVLADKKRGAGAVPDLVAIPSNEKVGRAIDVLQEYGISQIPVAKAEAPDDIAEIVGSIHERSLLDRVFRDPDAIGRDVVEVMDGPLPVLQSTDSVEEMFAGLSRGAEAVVVAEGSKPEGVLSRADLLEFLAHQSSRA